MQAVSDLVNVMFEGSDIIEFWTLPSCERRVTRRDKIRIHYNWLESRNSTGESVCVGVAARKAEYDTWVPAYSRVIWADIDNKSVDEVLPEVLSGIGMYPSAVVDSGHGVHLYWRLHGNISTKEAVELSSAVAYLIDADPAVCDESRIMRLPGFVNMKPPVKNTILIEANDNRYYAEYFRKTIRESLPEKEREVLARAG